MNFSEIAKQVMAEAGAEGAQKLIEELQKAMKAPAQVDTTEFDGGANGKFHMESRMERTSKKTGKKYKKWESMGWYPLPIHLNELSHHVKGSYLFVTYPNGDIDRYLVKK